MKPPLRRPVRGLPLRAVAPNAVTALALCFGLSGIRYGIGGEWERAVLMIMVAGVLDGLDGRVARMLHGASRFGAELDSLSDVVSFGVSPAVVVYLWALIGVPKVGWICALILAVFCALRLARFNANIDVVEQPHKSAGFLTGVPAPAGALLAMLPMYCWFWSGIEWFRSPLLVAPWIAFVALMMVSSFATFSWSSMRLRANIRFEALAVVVLFGAALLSAPWQTLTVLCVGYVLAIPFSMRAYGRVRRLRGAGPRDASPPDAA